VKSLGFSVHCLAQQSTEFDTHLSATVPVLGAKPCSTPDTPGTRLRPLADPTQIVLGIYPTTMTSTSQKATVPDGVDDVYVSGTTAISSMQTSGVKPS
jgi:hypothetical protein